jgi:hypothetical protein
MKVYLNIVALSFFLLCGQSSIAMEGEAFNKRDDTDIFLQSAIARFEEADETMAICAIRRIAVGRPDVLVGRVQGSVSFIMYLFSKKKFQSIAYGLLLSFSQSYPATWKQEILAKTDKGHTIFGFLVHYGDAALFKNVLLHVMGSPLLTIKEKYGLLVHQDKTLSTVRGIAEALMQQKEKEGAVKLAMEYRSMQQYYTNCLGELSTAYFLRDDI